MLRESPLSRASSAAAAVVSLQSVRWAPAQALLGVGQGVAGARAACSQLSLITVPVALVWNPGETGHGGDASPLGPRSAFSPAISTDLAVIRTPA